MTPPLRSVARASLADALAVLLPVDCAGCGRPDRALCEECRAALAPAPVRRVLPDGTVVSAGLVYAGVARATILALKEGGAGTLAAALAPALAAGVADLPAAEACAVPSSPEARRRRGFSPVGLVARRAGLHLVPALAAEPGRGEQKALPLAERLASRSGALHVTRPVAARRLLLVDDVVTSGATLLAAAEALREGGAEVVGAAVIAAVPSRREGAPPGSERILGLGW